MHRFPAPMLLTLIMLLPLRAQAQAVPPSIRVHGESLVSVAPDEAEMDIGIVSQGSTTEEAGAQNTAAVNRGCG